MTVSNRIEETVSALNDAISEVAQYWDIGEDEAYDAILRALPIEGGPTGAYVNLDTFALRDVFRGLLNGRVYEGQLKSRSISYFNRISTDDGYNHKAIDGSYAGVWWVIALSMALAALEEEAFLASEERENADLLSADAFWTGISNGLSHATARDLARFA